jgi:uncharacterized membrane protein YGL010W
MKTIHQWFAQYDQSHRHPKNKAIHWVCVPLIMFSTVGLLWEVPLPWVSCMAPQAYAHWVNAGCLLVVLALLFYLRLSVALFLGMVVMGGLALLYSVWVAQVEHPPAWLINLSIFGIAWTGQFVGHRIEGVKPSFFEDLQFLLIGPAWVLGFVYKKLGIQL